VSGTTYYASQTISGCESTTRTPVTLTSGACLSTDEFERDTLKVYPNPVLEQVTISYTKPISSIEILNMIGQVVVTKTINDTTCQIDMAPFASGPYLIRVAVEDKIEIVKVIKK
jgi:hypothetical protein